MATGCQRAQRPPRTSSSRRVFSLSLSCAHNYVWFVLVSSCAPSNLLVHSLCSLISLCLRCQNCAFLYYNTLREVDTIDLSALAHGACSNFIATPNCLSVTPLAARELKSVPLKWLRSLWAGAPFSQYLWPFQAI